MTFNLLIQYNIYNAKKKIGFNDLTFNVLYQLYFKELVFTDHETDSHRDYIVEDPIVLFNASAVADPQIVKVDLIDDECYEPDETFTVSLGALTPQVCSFTSAPVSVDVTIKDDDCK